MSGCPVPGGGGDREGGVLHTQVNVPYFSSVEQPTEASSEVALWKQMP